MASSLKNLSTYNRNAVPSATNKKIGIVVSEWNEHITFAMLNACIETLLQYGATTETIFVQRVPGTFELPFAANKILEQHKVDGVICIGCVIKGETDHDIYINQSVANALQQINITKNKPVIFGVLTPNTEQQALDRAGGKHGNKGVEAAITLLKMLEV